MFYIVICFYYYCRGENKKKTNEILSKNYFFMSHNLSFPLLLWLFFPFLHDFLLDERKTLALKILLAPSLRLTLNRNLFSFWGFSPDSDILWYFFFLLASAFFLQMVVLSPTRGWRYYRKSFPLIIFAFFKISTFPSFEKLYFLIKSAPKLSLRLDIIFSFCFIT